jgi:TetR/AcrR family transcriptional regulator
MSGGARRQYLIDQAIHLFATLGFRGTTTKAIAQAAGVSEAVIFRHFARKEDLYAAILQQKADEDRLDELVVELRTFADRGEDDLLVSRLAEHILESHRKDPDFYRVFLFAALEGHDLVKAGRAYGLPLFGFLYQYVVERQRAGVFQSVDPAVIVFGLIALPTHFATVDQLFGAELHTGSDRRLVEMFTGIILDGLRQRTARRVRARSRVERTAR